jgi:outer membrane protein OmpA-like peptidoglycan-associated protein
MRCFMNPILITTAMPAFFLFRMILLGLLATGAIANAQSPLASDSPSTAQMIEQLKAPAVQPAARTRSLRNLGVEAADTSGPSTPVRPSLSLQILFDLNSARVHAQSQQALRNLAQALQSPDLSTAKFAVEGHTDAKGRAEYNQKLSALRADAVRDYLAQQGVDASRLVPSGKGASDLANTADPLAAENRRVRIVNLE